MIISDVQFGVLGCPPIPNASAYADGWESLDDCFAEGQSLVETYIAYADAALGVIKKQAKK